VSFFSAAGGGKPAKAERSFKGNPLAIKEEKDSYLSIEGETDEESKGECASWNMFML